MFSIPAFILMTIRRESFRQGIALSEQHRFLTLRGKLTLSFTFNLVATVNLDLMSQQIIGLIKVSMTQMEVEARISALKT